MKPKRETQRSRAVANLRHPIERQVRFLVLTVGITAGGLMGWAFAAESEPTVADLQKRLESPDLQVRRDAASHLVEYGPEALPALELLLKSAKDNDQQISTAALQAIARIGPAAESAVPALIEYLQRGDDQQRYRAAYALGSVSLEHPELLMPAMKHPSPRVRTAGALSIGWMGDAAEPLLDELSRLFADPEIAVSSAASESMRQLGSQVVSLLQHHLDHETAEVRQRAARVLGEIGPDARDAFAGLIQHHSDKEASVRAAITLAVPRIAPNDPQTATIIAASLSDTELVVRLAALEALASAPEAALPLLPAVVQQLDAGEDAARRAAELLAQLGPKASPTLPELLTRLSNTPNDLLERAISRQGTGIFDDVVIAVEEGRVMPPTAARILGSLGPSIQERLVTLTENTSTKCRSLACLAFSELSQDAATVSLLTPFLSDPDTQVRAAAADALGRQGTLAGTAREAILSLTNDPIPATRSAALGAIVQIGGPADQLMGPILAGLTDSDASVRLYAMQGLKALDPLPSAAVETLQTTLNDREASVRAASAEALGRGKKAAAPAIADLVRHLQDPDDMVKQRCAEALGGIGELPPEAVDALLEVSRSTESQLRKTATMAIGLAGPSAAIATDRLKELAQDASPDIRETALKAMARVHPDRSQAISIVTAGLEDGDWTVRRQAAQILGDWGAEAVPAVPRLLKLMRSGQDSEAATEALRKIDTAPPEAMPMILEILEDPNIDRRRRFYALHLLRKLGTDAKASLPTLRKLLENAEGRSRELLEKAISDIEAIGTEKSPGETQK